ncbi:MAG: polysaccharide pyruvyl transferase family protein [Desulfonauticus sp.]|nr:polysaccharide pyruvyl transferase family protein [Desulfonauticus sp.]
MKLFFYRPEILNFGDYLNAWLWPKIFPGLFDDNEEIIFVGIGTILDDRLPKHPQKIIFGSGIRFPNNPPKIDKKWDIRVLRGKLSARILNVDEKIAITDPAILVSLFWDKSLKTVYEFGYIPYFRSISPMWKIACKLVGIKYIDPRRSVEKCISEIANCKYIFSEAMHGAILADTFRIPWLPIRSFNAFHEGEVHFFKWLDWCSSLDLPFEPKKLPIFWPINTFKNSIKNSIKLGYIVLNFIKMKNQKKFFLSNEKKFKRAIERYIETIEKFKTDYGIN